MCCVVFEDATGADVCTMDAQVLAEQRERERGIQIVLYVLHEFTGLFEIINGRIAWTMCAPNKT
jgi:hypothetical protein